MNQNFIIQKCVIDRAQSERREYSANMWSLGSGPHHRRYTYMPRISLSLSSSTRKEPWRGSKGEESIRPPSTSIGNNNYCSDNMWYVYKLCGKRSGEISWFKVIKSMSLR